MCIIEWVESVYSQSIRTGTFLILALIGIVFVLSLLFSKRKKVHLTLLIFMVVFYIFAKVHCGASLKDVSVMKPMAEAISNYIVKNGIPKSLEDIPDLPYELEGCNKDEYYQNYKSYKHVRKQNATLKQTEEECHFRNIILEFGFTTELKTLKIGGRIKMVSNNKTILNLFFNNRNNIKKFKFEKIDIGSSKRSGICNPMRQ